MSAKREQRRGADARAEGGSEIEREREMKSVFFFGAALLSSNLLHCVIPRLDPLGTSSVTSNVPRRNRGLKGFKGCSG